jgi:excisionase family DNA binding protein
LQPKISPVNSLLTVKQVAERLNIQIGTVYKWAEANKLPCVKVGYMLRFRPEHIERFLTEREVRA